MLVHELSTAICALLVNGDYMLAESVGSLSTALGRVNHAAEHLCCVEILNPFQESYLLWTAINNLFRESRNES